MKKKLRSLRDRLRQWPSVLIAFSGGKDSFFLTALAEEALGAEKVFPRHMRTPFSTQASRRRVAYFQKSLRCHIRFLTLDLLSNPHLRVNSRQRCYYCKLLMFRALQEEARRLHVPIVLDGSTTSDLSEHRPGRKALERLAIASPLAEAGISSPEIAAYLRQRKIPAAYLHSSTCLATRFPYHFPMKRSLLHRLDQVEEFLLEHGISPVRARYLADGVRIESSPAHFARIISLRRELQALFSSRQWKFITLDLGGLKRGPWD